MRRQILPGLLMVLTAAAPLLAQDALNEQSLRRAIGSIDFGARLIGINGDPARNQRYRDLREGPVLDGFRYTSDQRSWRFDAAADHVGYRDQRYVGSFEKLGRVKASFEWDQIPLFNSADTRTLFTETAPGVFRIDDRIQQGIAAGTLRLADVTPDAKPFELRSRRDIANVRLAVTPTRNLDLTLNVNSTNKSGAQQWGVGFGFGSLVEVPAPLEHRTTDLDTGAEWADGRAMVRIGYNGSWFDNRVTTLVIDNPLQFTDTTTATSQARMSLWPNSNTHAVNAAGSIKLPVHTTATAFASVGSWNQNDLLIPFTINTAIAPILLPRGTAEAEARVVAMNYTVTSRPLGDLWLNARFKRYDFDNRTPHFPVVNYVRMDAVVTRSVLGGSEALGYARNNFDADASFTRIPLTALRFGYGWEEVRRTFLTSAATPLVATTSRLSRGPMASQR